MNPTWQAYLQSRNAAIQNGCVIHYGDAAAELNSVCSNTLLIDLSHLGLIYFSGEDAQAFLQGQLSCDVRKIDLASAQYGSYCNPKGRMLASFLIWYDGDGYMMQLPSTLRAAIQKRLSMFVLRAKVQLADSSDTPVRIGVTGKRAAELVEKILGGVPGAHLGVMHSTQERIVRLAADRFELITTQERAPALWEQLNGDAVPAGGGPAGTG